MMVVSTYLLESMRSVSEEEEVNISTRNVRMSQMSLAVFVERRE